MDDEKGGWLFDGVDEGMFVAWTDREGDLTGAAHIAKASGDGTIESRSFRLSGVRDGDDVSLTIDGGALTSSLTWTGRFNKKVLLLAVVQDDGTLQQLRFLPASIDDFNGLVAGVSAMSERQAADAAEVEAATEAAREAARAREALDAAVDGLGQATARLAAGDHFDGAVSDYDEALVEIRDSASALDGLIASHAECVDIGVALVDVNVARTSVSVAHTSWEVAVNDLDHDKRQVNDQLEVVVSWQAHVPRVDQPAGLTAAVGAARSALKAVTSRAVQVSARIRGWDADADAVVSSSEKKANVACP
ncbi:MAG: hypothetical protein JWO68_2663 [Actinomycetia bacterium]|nr:hypothetical protein [Actinomycetes bacterium]